MNGGTCEVYKEWLFLLREIENLRALCVPNFVASNGSYVCWVVNLLFLKLWLWLVVLSNTKILEMICMFKFGCNCVFFCI
jgi:hypothetical protein